MVMLEDRRDSAITIYNNMFQTQTQKRAVYLEKTASKLVGVLNVRSIFSVIVTVDLISAPDNKANNSGG